MTGLNGAAGQLSTAVELSEIADKLAKLTRTEILVYLVLRCHALDGAGRAFPSLTTIAREAHCGRRKVPDAINKLIALGLIAKQQRRSKTGDFNSTEYTLVDAQRDEGGSAAQGTRWCHTGHQVVPSQGTKLLKRKKLTEKEPPSGEGGRAREGAVFSNEVDRRQGTLLLPTRGGGDRNARLAVIKAYNPSPALSERAAELGIDARDEDVFGKWQRHRIATNRLPLDHEAAEADFENWIREEWRRRNAGPSRGRRPHSTPGEDEAAAGFYAEMGADPADGGAANG